jgi:hypothetical protein
MDPKGGPDTKTDWATDRMSQYTDFNFDFDLKQVSLECGVSS